MNRSKFLEKTSEYVGGSILAAALPVEDFSMSPVKGEYLVDSFRNNTEYQFMVGGQWVAHPGGVID